MPSGSEPIRTLLVANRGEIALRVMRTAREMGIRTVAVASAPDWNAPHALYADERIAIGEGPAANSYLDLGRIIDAARQSGADAIHPGYGFLSERPELSEACAEAGIRFVGPPAAAMKALGDKISAKTVAERAGVPIVPGYYASGASDRDLREAADRIGYPIMLKASAGGGGRGMRIVRDPAEFDGELGRARDEAIKAFGDGAMMVERLIERPRHIEIQAIADAYGEVVTLFERECSIQRRHQKLIEEAPSPFVSPEMRAEMSEVSKRLLKEVGYVGAATIEFIVDPVRRDFAFLEVNARLQVEHPVTEAITGFDLVRLQLQVAAGEPLAIAAPDAPSGWSIEARVIAEDPARDFLPSVGHLHLFGMPSGVGIRVDSGYIEGSEVSPFYDSLLAKVIAHGPDRESARRRLVAALRETHVIGVATNVGFLIDVLEDEAFASGEISTGTLAERFGDWHPAPAPTELSAIANALVGVSSGAAPIIGGAGANNAAGGVPSAWDRRDGFRNVRTLE